MVRSEAAVLGAAIAGSWSAYVLGWLGGVPPWALAATTGLPLSAWLARMYLTREGVRLDQRFRPDAREKAGQRATLGCLVVSFGALLAAAAQMPFRPRAVCMWYVPVCAIAALAGAAVCLLLAAFSLRRKWRERPR